MKRTPEERAQRIHALLWSDWPPSAADWDEVSALSTGPKRNARSKARVA